MKHTPYSFKYPKKFTWRGFRRFSWDAQEVLCKRYDIVLVDYETRNEKIIRHARKFNMKNFNRAMKALDKGIEKFSKAVK